MCSSVSPTQEALDDFIDVPWNPLDGIDFVIKEQTQAISSSYFSKNPQESIESSIIRLKGRDIRVYGFSEQEKEKELEDAFNELLEPAFTKEALNQAIAMFLKESQETFPQIAKQCKEILPDLEQTPFKTKQECSQYLGGGFLRWISPFLRTCWLLRKEQVPKFVQMIEHFQSFAQEKGNDEELVLAQRLKEKFTNAADYLLEDEELEEILPVTKRSLQEPRLELLKQELRRYFHVENLRVRVTEEMYQKIDQISQTLSIDQREELGSELLSIDEKRKLLSAFGFEFHFSDEEEMVFFDFLKMSVSFPVEELLRPTASVHSTVAEEIIEYLQSSGIKPFLSPGKEIFTSLLGELTPLMSEFSKEDLADLLYKVDQNPSAFSALLEKWPSFSALFFKHRNTPLILAERPLSNSALFRECLKIFEKNVLNSLERTCSKAKVAIEFRQRGYDIRLGALQIGVNEADRMIAAHSDEDEETVLV